MNTERGRTGSSDSTEWKVNPETPSPADPLGEYTTKQWANYRGDDKHDTDDERRPQSCLTELTRTRT